MMSAILMLMMLVMVMVQGALGDEKTAVLTLTSSNVTMVKDGRSWLIMFYAPWCGHCQRMKPIWRDLALELHGHTVVAQVNGDENLPLVSRFGVSGYPTVVHVTRGSAVRVFSGDRSKASLAAFSRGGFASVAPLSFWKSPLSVIGEVVGFVVWVGTLVLDAKDYLLASNVPMVLVVAYGIGALLALSLVLSLITVCCVSLFDRKPKQD